jgi:hypothetical protein
MKAMQKGAAILAAVALAPLTLSGCGNDDEVTAPSTNGSISILTSTSGDIGSGYLVRVDDGMERSVEPNGSVIYAEIALGDHEVTLLSLPLGCLVDGANPRPVSVTADEIARVTFVVTCDSEPPGKPGDPIEPPA